jgi:7,8-dihydropterin-6-yl-methyl-4-(beta-D-ribofuranosyl)aminobenzene 5'-phosphate synthase
MEHHSGAIPREFLAFSSQHNSSYGSTARQEEDVSSAPPTKENMKSPNTEAIKPKETISLPEVDEAKLMIIMDNSIDILMANDEVAHRFPLVENLFECPIPIAEHGFSVLIDVKQGSKHSTVLFDTGVSRRGILYNMDALEVNAADISAIVLSHGHPDHAMGLPGLIDRLDERNLPLVLHPDAYLERKLVLPNGNEISVPAPNAADFRREYIEIIEEVGPSMLMDNMILVSGEVARTTEFEKGIPIHYAKRNDVWEPDPLIMDDQCAIINVRGKGLVIVTGCGHSGIINTIRHAQALTGVPTVYAVIGGFHLTGALFEPIIPATIAALQEIKPRYVMPGHCTGWSATHQIAQAMPEAFIPNSVGTTLVL